MPLPAWQRTYLAGAAGAIAFLLTYVGVDYARGRRLFYFPLEREYRIALHPPALAMGYVGLWGSAALAFVLVGGVLWLALGRRREPVSARLLGLGYLWLLTAILLALGYYTWNNWP